MPTSVTFFVMSPTIDKVYTDAYQPYAENRIAFDEALDSCFRNALYPQYKANRPPTPPDLKAQERGDFLAAWGGIAGLQFSLPAVWTEARRRGRPTADPSALDDAAWAEFVPFIDVIVDHPANRFLPLHLLQHLLHKDLANLRRVCVRSTIDVGVDGNSRLLELDRIQRGGELFVGRFHQVCVKCTRHSEWYRLHCARCFRQSTGFTHRFFCP